MAHIFKIEAVSMEYRNAEVKDTVDYGWFDRIGVAVERATHLLMTTDYCEARVLMHRKPTDEQVADGISEDETFEEEVWCGEYYNEDGEEGFVYDEYNVCALFSDESVDDSQWERTKREAIDDARSCFYETECTNVIVYEYRALYGLNGMFKEFLNGETHYNVFELSR